MTRAQGWFVVGLILAVWGVGPVAEGAGVERLRLPPGAYQPQAAVDEAGVVHVIYATGDAHAADIQYMRSEDGGASFSQPMRVNSQAGSAMPIGTVRGPQLAVGRDGRPHVAWMGAQEARPRGPEGGAPMLYSRLNDAGDGFEPQRNLVTREQAEHLDGGGTVAADASGRVYVVWHGGGAEPDRRVWVARSEDDGARFGAEVAVDSGRTGVCGCCNLTAFADGEDVFIAYRAATRSVHRDMYLLHSGDGGETFDEGVVIDAWEVAMCPMSTASIVRQGQGLLVAWETEGEVYFAGYGEDGERRFGPVAAAGEEPNRKHPRLAVNEAGRILLVWTEGTGWNRGGALAWQVYTAEGRPVREGRGRVPEGIATWSVAAPFVNEEGEFVIVH